MKVEQEILAVLSTSHFDGHQLLLPMQLDRKTYEKVAKVIEWSGGKWSKKAKAHVFAEPAADALDQLFLTGEISNVKQDLGQFDTPPHVVAWLIRLANIETGMKVYEPSAGIGNIVGALREATGKEGTVFGHELDPKRHAQCMTNQFSSFGAGGLGLGDFLKVEPNPVFDRVVMNPPFAKQADMAHVQHASLFLKPGGRLVSVMSPSFTFRQDSRTVAFRSFLDDMEAETEVLPEGSFKSSGTGINTVIVHFDN